MTDFAIHALPAGGGTLAVAPVPAEAAAVQTLLAWQPDLVISMTGKEEMEKLGAGDLGQVLEKAGVKWLHLPTIDYGTPDSGGVNEITREAVATLAKGGKVLTHCRGGCGRAGMMALRVMIGAGEAAEPALDRLRAVRSCAVETEAQLTWAKA
jgi:protein-tyrosine phosphatase